MLNEIIIPAAGLGTRMYPITNGKISKLMLKIKSKPVISYAIDEALNSNFNKVYVILNEDHKDLINFVKDEYPNVNIITTPLTKGNACSMLKAKNFIKENFFATMMPDILIKSDIPPLLKMKEAFEKFKSNISGLSEIPEEEKKYFPSVQKMNLSKIKPETFEILEISHKANKGISIKNQGNLIFSRHILSKDFFDIVEEQEKSDDIEILIELMKYQKFIGIILKGRLFDLGNVKGYRRALELL